MNEKIRKEKLAALEKEWEELHKKKARYEFYLKGVNGRIAEVLEEIKKL